MDITQIDSARLAKIARDLGTLSEYASILQGEVNQMAHTLREHKLQLEQARVDELIAQADSPTAVWKALESPGNDRRTWYDRVERVVLANGLDKAYPKYSTHLELNRYLAQRDPASGERRIVVALRELDEGR